MKFDDSKDLQTELPKSVHPEDNKFNQSSAETQLQSSKEIAPNQLVLLENAKSFLTSKDTTSITSLSKNETRQLEYRKFLSFMSKLIFHGLIFYTVIILISVGMLSTHFWNQNFLPHICYSFIFFSFFEFSVSLYFFVEKVNKGKPKLVSYIITQHHLMTLISFTTILIFYADLISLKALTIIVIATVVIDLIYFIIFSIFKTRYLIFPIISLLISLTVLLVVLNLDRTLSNFPRFLILNAYKIFQFILFLIIIVNIFISITFTMYLNFRTGGINTQLKTIIIFSFGAIISLTCYFLSKYVEILKTFGDWSALFVKKDEPTNFEEYINLINCCLLLCCVLFFLLMFIAVQYKTEMRNILFKMSYDFDNFLSFLLKTISGGFGYVEEKQKKEELKSRFDQIKTDFQEKKLDLNKCVFCVGKKPNVMFDPCKHLIFCDSCFHKIKSETKQCPACTRKIKQGIVFDFIRKTKKFVIKSIVLIKAEK